MSIILLINFTCATYLAGLILTVQLVHYPSFIYIDPKIFRKFHKFHIKKISIAVMIPMIIELASSVALVYLSPITINIILLIMITFIWISTIALSVPRHNQLSSGKSPRLISELILTNWPRAILWPSRSIILFIILTNSIL